MERQRGHLDHSLLDRLRLDWRRSAFALHRLALHLEERGHLYYLHKKPRGSGAGCFVALQRAIEPQVQHVIHVTEESRLHGEEGGSGQGDHTQPDEPGVATGEGSGKL